MSERNGIRRFEEVELVEDDLAMLKASTQRVIEEILAAHGVQGAKVEEWAMLPDQNGRVAALRREIK